MPTALLRINGRSIAWDGDPAQPLLWTLRDDLGLTGTKYGCGEGHCGACTVHVNGSAARACSVPTGAMAGQDVTTIEGLEQDRALQAVQQAWLDEQVPQCGYCQVGQIMGAVALLAQRPEPNEADVNRALSGHLCRCGSYVRIRRAVLRAAAALRGGVR